MISAIRVVPNVGTLEHRDVNLCEFTHQLMAEIHAHVDLHSVAPIPDLNTMLVQQVCRVIRDLNAGLGHLLAFYVRETGDDDTIWDILTLLYREEWADVAA